MTRNEAFKAMIDGHKIRHEDYSSGSYSFFNGLEFMFFNEILRKVQEVTTALEYLDGYEIYTEKKTEKVTWYQVDYHKKGTGRNPNPGIMLYKSKDEFLAKTGCKSSDFHWIKLEEVYTHEYLTEDN